ncbi:hypothetical protein [Parapedobacter sp. 10938]|uniref:hypothetical protein n=1 Tax=Parapedobacter flavus TaxID=3110225 RepID=UPI002DBE9C75|nr:hypothetical protein [Parapedobacter sp. 10938]MEC3878781.1 hypothetical protein [Parapedobacter sp. 10938]
MSVVALLVGACAKDEAVVDAQPDERDPITAARSAFENKHGGHADGNTTGSPQKQGNLDWEEAFTTHGRQTMYVFVPIRAEETYYAGEPGGRQHPVTARLRASNTDGKWAFDLVLYIPEGNGWEASGEFTGTAIAEAWFGGRSRMAHFYDGRLLANGHGPDGRITKLMGTTCYTTTVSAYVNGVLNTTHTSTTCIGSGGPGPDDGWGPLPEPDPRIGNEDDTSPTYYTRDIINQIDDLCLKQTIDKALTYSASAMDLISDIIKELDGNVGLQIDINVVDGITPKGKPGEAAGQDLTSVGGIPTIFKATIILHEGYMPDASQEGAVSIFIHEVLHAYLSKAELLNSTGKTDQHQTMATKYVGPMASYLQGLFGISKLDAFSLAWSGLTYTGAYANVSSFDIDGNSYLKDDIVQAAAKYMGRGADGNLLDGTELCEN